MFAAKAEKQTCPRREGGLGPWERGEGLDSWLPGSTFAGARTEYEGVRLRHCSFCGSLHPDDFVALVEKGYTVGPTDKSYKVYLQITRSDEEREAGVKATGFDLGGADIGKFYPYHMSAAQGDRFRELYASGEMKIGYPGHFYHGVAVPKTEG